MAEPVHSITDAPRKHSEEQYGRMLRYTIAMAIRIVCFVLAAVVGVVWETWWAMALVAAAVVLPYVAVIDANAGGDRYMASRESEGLDTQNRLTTGPSEAEDLEPPQWWEAETEYDDDPRPPQVIPGEVVLSADPQDADEGDPSTVPGEGQGHPGTEDQAGPEDTARRGS